MTDNEVFTTRWEELDQVDRAAFFIAWEEAFGGAPPHILSMILMRKVLIWEVLFRAFGGQKMPR